MESRSVTSLWNVEFGVGASVVTSRLGAPCRKREVGVNSIAKGIAEDITIPETRAAAQSRLQAQFKDCKGTCHWRRAGQMGDTEESGVIEEEELLA